MSVQGSSFGWRTGWARGWDDPGLLKTPSFLATFAKQLVRPFVALRATARLRMVRIQLLGQTKPPHPQPLSPRHFVFPGHQPAQAGERGADPRSVGKNTRSA